MKTRILAYLFFLYGPALPIVNLHNGFTFGPVLNWSFGTKSHYRSIGFDAYYWEFRDGLPWSLGLGYEHGSDSQNLFFAEGQTGWVLAGANLRYRYLGESSFCPGLYISIPKVRTTGNFE